MPVIVLEASDFTSPLFLVRTWAVLSGCAAFSLAASLDAEELSRRPDAQTFRIFCMFTWCFFFVLTLLIHVLSIIQFHSLIPISWKNLTMTAAALGALMTLSSSVLFPWLVVNRERPRPRPVAAAVASCLTVAAYASEGLVLRTRGPEQRGYVGSVPGLLKVLQLWGGCQMIPLVAEVLSVLPAGASHWPVYACAACYAACLLLSLVTLAVLLGDLAGRCCLPFDRFLAGFSVTGVLLYMLATVVCFTMILQLREPQQHQQLGARAELVVVETVVSSVTLLAYTVDLAFSIKLLCDRSHM